MERAARLLNSKKFPQKLLDVTDLVRGVWPSAVGKAIASHTQPVKVVRSRLVVEVEDAIWQRQLFALTGQILANVQKAMGNTAVQDIEFRIGAERRPPQRAFIRETMPTAALDDAEGIQDPVLKKVYRLSRTKAAV
jgi:predicted nucleic acid-binding Zn ribbon protein